MTGRLLVSALLPDAVVARAKTEFAALVHPGPADMTADEVVAAAVAHGVQAILFVNTLRFDAPLIARLPESLRIGATCSVGYDHIDVAAATGTRDRGRPTPPAC